jgi:uncharacterized protein
MNELLFVSTAVFLGAIVSGLAGFAFSAVAGAILLHAMDADRAVPLMMACSVASQLFTAAALRKSLRFSADTALLIAGACGVVLSVLARSWIDGQSLRWFFGAFLGLYASYLLLRRMPARPTPSGPLSQVLVGAIGGAIGALTAMPGAIPSVWCELRGCTKEQQRGLVQPFIILTQVFALALLALGQKGIPGSIGYDLMAAGPALLLGSWLGLVAFGRVNDAVFRKLVLLLLIVSGVMMLR